jgi:heat shock protein HtpX
MVGYSFLDDSFIRNPMPVYPGANQPYGLISALQKLGAYNQRIPTTVVSPTTGALCIVQPLFGRGGLSSLFSTHPPLEERIAALRQMSIVPQR